MATEAVDYRDSLSNSRFTAPRLLLRAEQGTFGDSAVRNLATALTVSPLTARVLCVRGISSPEAAQAFLAPSLREHLPDPRQMLNIESAASLILDTIQAKRRITIFHDFDVDGLTAGAQLTEFLRALSADVRCYVPHRITEGYGLSISGVDAIIEAGSELLITVDCGISDREEIAYAKKRGLKVIVLDHHEPAELPVADVIVDPAQQGCPFQQYRLAAAGVVWMLLIVLRREALEKRFAGSAVPDPKDFLDLAALGTICDMVPLTEVNRLIAYRGIEAMQQTKRVGLRALMEIAGVFQKPRFGAGHVSFALGPRINAAGRLDDARHVGELFATKDAKRAKRIAEKIDKLNSQRKSIEEQTKRSCIDSLKLQDGSLDEPALAVFGEQFHQGVIGIVAQRLVEEFNRPAAVMAPAEVDVQGRKCSAAKGSVRSISGFHVAEVLHSMHDLLLSGGGHAAAGGFSVEMDKLEAFRQAFVAEAKRRLSADALCRQLTVDVSTGLGEIDFSVAEELQRLAPFGVGNSSPLLVSENLVIDSALPISGKHLKLRLSDGKSSRQAIAWNFFGHPKARKGETVDAVYQVEINTYQGVSSVQLNIKALL